MTTADFQRESAPYVAQREGGEFKRSRGQLGMLESTLMYRWDPVFVLAKYALERQKADPLHEERATSALRHLHVNAWNSGCHRGLGQPLEKFRSGSAHGMLSQEFDSMSDPHRAPAKAEPEPETGHEFDEGKTRISIIAMPIN